MEFLEFIQSMTQGIYIYKFVLFFHICCNVIVDHSYSVPCKTEVKVIYCANIITVPNIYI